MAKQKRETPEDNLVIETPEKTIDIRMLKMARGKFGSFDAGRIYKDIPYALAQSLIKEKAAEKV